GGGNAAAVFQPYKCVQLGGRIGVTVIGADHQRIFAHAAQNQIWHVVADLTGDEDAAALEQIVRQSAIDRIETAAQFINHPGHPGGCGFNESEAKFRKELGDAAVDDAKQRADIKDPILIEEIPAAVGIDHHVHRRGAAVGLVQTDTKIHFLSFLVEWE